MKKTLFAFFCVGLFAFGMPLYGQDADWISEGPEIFPSFPGGDVAWSCFMDSALNKDILQNLDSSGWVIVRFKVDTLGKIKNIEVLHSYNKEVDAELVRITQIMPDWIPASINGYPIEMKMMSSISIPYKNRCPM